MSVLPNQQDVDAVIATLSDAPVGPFEKPFPDFGTLKAAIGERSDPLRELHSVVKKLAAIWGRTVTPELMESYEQVCRQRSDEALNDGLRVAQQDKSERMPTPAQFRGMCERQNPQERRHFRTTEDWLKWQEDYGD